MHCFSEPLVSVITPVYNGEKYLADCIESVLAQTYPNWEYIIVNNCSRDRSYDIARGYAERDLRIRVHDNTQFLSAIQNFNHAFKLIAPESKYCKELHADDWLLRECVEKMVAVAERDQRIGIVGSYRIVGTMLGGSGIPYPQWKASGRDIARQALGGAFSFGTPTTIMVRSDIVRERGRYYDERYLHADKMVCYDILKKWDYGFVPQILTGTRHHPESQTRRIADRYNTMLLENLHMLTMYGPFYLSPSEYEKAVVEYLERYYAFFARSLARIGDKGFWEYHRKGLAEVGFEMNRVRIAFSAFLWVVDKILNPKRSLEKLYLKIAEQRSAIALKNG